MSRNDFLKKIKAQREACTGYYEGSKKGLTTIKQVHKLKGLKLPRVGFNPKDMLKKVINDSLINYSLDDFFIKCEAYTKRTNIFTQVSSDLAKIKELVDKKEISYTSFLFFSLSLYAANFDSLINFLEPIANEIQKTKKYVLINSKNKVITYGGNSDSVLTVFNYFDKQAGRSLNKLLDKDLRNSIAHDSWDIKNDCVTYYPKEKIVKNQSVKYLSKKINGDSFFKKFTLFGLLINNIQKFLFNQVIKKYTHILKKRMTKKQSRNYLNTVRL